MPTGHFTSPRGLIDRVTQKLAQDDRAAITLGKTVDLFVKLRREIKSVLVGCAGSDRIVLCGFSCESLPSARPGPWLAPLRDRQLDAARVPGNLGPRANALSGPVARTSPGMCPWTRAHPGVSPGKREKPSARGDQRPPRRQAPKRHRSERQIARATGRRSGRR